VEGGKRKQKYFKTKVKAEEWQEEREDEALEHGTAQSMTATERSVVIGSRETLDSLGVSLREVLEQGIDYFERVQRSATVGELVNRVILERKQAGRSSRYLDDLDYRLTRFRKDFEDRPVATITRDEVRDWLQALKLKPASHNSYRRVLVLAFNEAIDAGFAVENPARKVKVAKVDEEPPAILTPIEAEAVLTGADPDILPAIAIGLFAGVRDAEIKRMDWGAVNLRSGNIAITAKWAKGAQRRVIPVSDNLKAWLKPFARSSGKIWPSSGRNLHEAARKAAGFGTDAMLTNEEREKGVKLDPWPKNALRHSYATYYQAHHKDSGALAEHMGHTNTRVTYNHYRDAVEPEEAAKFWKIFPKKRKGRKVVSMVS
jgi:integrase